MFHTTILKIDKTAIGKETAHNQTVFITEQSRNSGKRVGLAFVRIYRLAMSCQSGYAVGMCYDHMPRGARSIFLSRLDLITKIVVSVE